MNFVIIGGQGHALDQIKILKASLDDQGFKLLTI